MQAGADILLFNVFAYGLDVLQSLAEDDEIPVPIMAHPAVSGAYSASKLYGISSPLLLGKLLRYAGADFSLFPSPYGSVALEKEEALAISKYLTEDDVFSRRAFPFRLLVFTLASFPLLYEISVKMLLLMLAVGYMDIQMERKAAVKLSVLPLMLLCKINHSMK